MLQRQRPYAFERHADGSRSLYYDAPEELECECGFEKADVGTLCRTYSKTNDARDAVHLHPCPKAPRIRHLPAVRTTRTRSAYLVDIGRTSQITDIAERCHENIDAFWARLERERFNTMGSALSKVQR